MNLLLSIVLATVAQEPAGIVEPAGIIEPSLEWIRRATGENIVSIELVSRRYESEGKPDLWLVWRFAYCRGNILR